MIIVSRGSVSHNGKYYGRGQVLPKMSRAEEQRLLGLGVCVEISAPAAVKAVPEPSPAVGGALPETPPADVNLNFNPDEIIKAKA